MNRPKEYIRYQRRAHIERKKRIIKGQNGYWHYRHEGELAKGKIHCSCPMCRHKSYDELKFSDKRKTVSALQDIEELFCLIRWCNSAGRVADL